ncbi:MAG: hypothetical protein RMJ05_03850 [Thermomicrobium sp.]|nr:hypothetical protein [Thermomicrobium sp.]MDW8005830.1 hypothetical protein [Thermomicrobium sp.]
MVWIESHVTLGRHPKTKRLCRLLGVSLPQAVGHLHLLWHWVLEFAPDGDVTEYVDDLAEAAYWDGEPDLFVRALLASGFLDQTEDERIVVHDWEEYAGRLLADRERKRAAREKERAARPDTIPTERPRTVRGQSVDSPWSVHGQSAHTVPTVPTVPNPPLIPPSADAPGGTEGGDALFEQVIAACHGVPPEQLTPAETRAARRAARALARIGATGDEVARRARNYRARFPDAALTPAALVRHWTLCAAPPNGASLSAQPPAAVEAVYEQLAELVLASLGQHAPERAPPQVC